MKTRNLQEVWKILKCRRLAAFGIAAALCLCSFFMAKTTLARAESDCRGLVQLRLSENGISAAHVFYAIEKRRQEQAADTVQPAYTAWTHSAGQEVSEPTIGRATQTDVIFYCGENSPRFLLPEESCMLPETAAYALWGTTEAQGYRMKLCGEWYRVERVIAGGDAVVHMSRAQAQRSGPAAFDRLELWLGDAMEDGAADSTAGKEATGGGTASFGGAGFRRSSFATERALEQLLRLCPAKVQLTLRCDELLACMKAWLGLPFWAAVIWVAARLFSAAGLYTGLYKGSKRFAVRIVAAAASLLLVWGLYRAKGLPVYIPQRCLPGAWSDLSFWASAIKAAGEGLGEYLAQEKRMPDAELLQALWRTAIASPAAAVAVVAGLRAWEKRPDPVCFAEGACSE